MFYIHSLSQAQDKWKLFLAIAILNFLGFCVNVSYRQKVQKVQSRSGKHILYAI